MNQTESTICRPVSRSVEDRKLRLLATQISLANEHDRRRLARVIHDDLSQPLAIAMMLLALVRQSPDAEGNGPAYDQTEALEKIEDLLAQAIEHARSVTSDLSPVLLYELGLVPAVKGLAVQTQRRHSLRVAVNGDLSIESVPADLRALLYQMIRELLSNVVRHARASNAWVTLAAEGQDGEAPGQRIRVEVRDDGVGFDPAGVRNDEVGLGLFDVETMLDQIGGRFTLTSCPGAGTTVRLWSPLLEFSQPTISSTNHRRHL